MSEAKRPQINISVDWDADLGFAPMGVGLPRDFLDGDPAHVCLTIIMMVLQPQPERVNRYPQALAILAGYAGSGAVTLTTQQFRRLERGVLKYMDVVGGERYFNTRNWDFAHYVHERAVARARRERLIASRETA